MKLGIILRLLGKKYPRNLSESYDHVGYQFGKKDMEKDVRKVFLCLDLSEKCQEELFSFRPDLIITHHPFYFGKRKEIISYDPKKAQLEEALSPLDAPVYSFHTNFDKAYDGMNDTLLGMLGYEDVEIGKDGILRIISVKEGIRTEDFAKKMLDRFGFDHCQIIDDGRLNHRIGFIAGGAGNEIFSAIKEDVDLFVSGDMSHHSRLDAKRYRLNYIEFPHEVEEEGFLTGFQNALLSIDPGLNIHPFAYETYFSLIRRKQDSDASQREGEA